MTYRQRAIGQMIFGLSLMAVSAGLIAYGIRLANR